MQEQLVALSKAIEMPDAVMYGIANQTWAIFGQGATLFDNTLRQVAPAAVQTVDAYVDGRIHPMSKKLPLMTATNVAFACVLYLLVIAMLYPVGQLIGKRTIKAFSTLHNLFLFLLSFYMWAGIIVTAAANGFTLWNNGVGAGDNSWRMAKLIWIFYVSKLPEFIDTVIMMLKHNYRQVSFLHLYHHGTIFIIWFLVTLEGPGGDAYFSAMLNSGVHVVMYGYYFGTAVFATGPIRRFLNSIKFFITYGQMTQFATNCVQSAYLLLIVEQAHYPKHLIHLLLWYMFTLLGLFGNFLIKNKAAAKKERAAKKAGKKD